MIFLPKLPKQLRFAYEKAIPAKAFREASEEYLKINLGQNILNGSKHLKALTATT
ncbi:hypothetical protein [Methyloglobulus sp.]|uniref:hypothetical protein n=1 Tax=Methyloglobulus sp. TaxID=2518622 RepID=UPI0032B7F8E1